LLVINAIAVLSFNMYHVVLSVMVDHRLLLIGFVLLQLIGVFDHEIILQAFVLITVR